MSTTQSYNLFLDDERDPLHVTWVSLPEDGNWVIAKSYDQFVQIIEERGLPTFVTFDHDLADEHYVDFFKAQKGNGTLSYHTYKEKTGHECAKWLIEYCMDKHLPFPEFAVHTMNVIGKENIENLIYCFQRFNQNESK